MPFLKPETYCGGYWYVDTGVGCFVVPSGVAGVANPDAGYLSLFMPEGIGMSRPDAPSDWTVEWREGWFGRLSAPGYLDCTDWESADSEEELIASLTEDYGYEEDEDTDEEEGDNPTAPHGWDSV